MKKIATLAIQLAATIGLAWTGANNTALVSVGDTGNAPDVNGLGAVNYTYSIGKYEVSANEYLNFLNAVGSVSVEVQGNSLYLYNPIGTINGRGTIVVSGSTFSVKEGKDNNPVNYVSAYAAAMYANWLSNGANANATEADYLIGAYDFETYGATISLFENRNTSAKYWMPTADEWYKAAYYSPDLNGGTGGYYGYATQSNTEPAASLPTTEANSANYDHITEDACTTIVGAYVNSASPYGTFDQAGNVSEWTEKIDGQNLVRLGGAYDSTSWHIRAAYSISTEPTIELYNIGFRIAALDDTPIPEPQTFALLFGLAAVLFAARRKRK